MATPQSNLEAYGASGLRPPAGRIEPDRPIGYKAAFMQPPRTEGRKMRHLEHGLGVALVAVLVACGPSPEDMVDIRSNQKQILNKLGDVDKQLTQVATAAAQRPAAPPAQPQEDPNKVYELPVGGSPVKGPANAKVAIVEFADFQ
jgi:hypothetical protein